jgi:hypothetical protein
MLRIATVTSNLSARLTPNFAGVVENRLAVLLRKTLEYDPIRKIAFCPGGPICVSAQSETPGFFSSNTQIRSNMQTEILSDSDTSLVDVDKCESPQSAETTAYNQALHQIEDQFAQLTAGFAQLDALKSEEAELLAGCDAVAAEEKAVLENQEATEKQSVDRLLKVRALRDIRTAKLTSLRKRIAQHNDLLFFDLAQPLRRSVINLAFALLAARRQRIEAVFFELLGNGADHGLPVSVTDLTERSKPVLELQRLCNWMRDPSSSQEEELNQWRSDLPQRWLAELRTVVAQEQSA